LMCCEDEKLLSSFLSKGTEGSRVGKRERYSREFSGNAFQ
jgi:hypothetical protein